MLEILLAFGLDLKFGDPPYRWHPIRIMGQGIQAGERALRFLIPHERMAGGILAVTLPVLVFLAVQFLLIAAAQVHFILERILAVYFLYSALAIHDLEKEARQVDTALRNRRLEAARSSLSRIVGRDTQNLDEKEIIRGTVETVAESYLDGVLAPLFYAALGGAPLALAYKAVNTLDSMIGHKTPRYLKFGSAAAFLDEMVNWIPARISWFFIGLAAFFVNGRGVEAWRVGWEDGADTSFSNGIVPEAAFAGALGVELGGTNYYGGQKVEVPKLGYPSRPLEREDIRTAGRLMKASAWASLGFALLLAYLMGLVYGRILLLLP